MKAMMIAVALAFFLLTAPKLVAADEQPSRAGLTTEVCDTPVKIAAGFGLTERTTTANLPQLGILTGSPQSVPDRRELEVRTPFGSVTLIQPYNLASGRYETHQQINTFGGELGGFGLEARYFDRLGGVAMGCKAEVDRFIEERRSKEE